MMHRSDIEHREAVDIAAELKGYSTNSALNLLQSDRCVGRTLLSAFEFDFAYDLMG